MSYSITVIRRFNAMHQLRLPDGSLEPLHGHDWRVGVTVGSEKLDSMGCVMDFHELEAQLEQMLAGWNHLNLNDCPPFLVLNPSAENVAATIAGLLRLPTGVVIERVEVEEAVGCIATYWK